MRKIIFVTGDTHNYIDVEKLNSKKFPQGKNLNKEDFLIVAGDFGFVWDGRKSDQYWLKWFKQKNFTTLFVDGNHENFDLLNQYPVESWNNGRIHRINDSVIHLMRGQVFEIKGKRIFTFGGAKSSDIEYRKEHISWWKEEMPSQEEYDEGIKNLEEYNWEVDYVITHTCSSNTLLLMNTILDRNKEIGEINEYFSSIERKLIYKHWFFGHFHKDYIVLPNQTVIFDDILKVDQ